MYQSNNRKVLDLEDIWTMNFERKRAKDLGGDCQEGLSG